MARYSKTAYVNGTSPAINATNLNKNENATLRNDQNNYFNLATIETRNLNVDSSDTFRKDNFESIKIYTTADIADGTQITVEIDDDGTTYNLYSDIGGTESVTELPEGVYEIVFVDDTTDFFFLRPSGEKFFPDAVIGDANASLTMTQEYVYNGSGWLEFLFNNAILTYFSIKIDGVWVVGNYTAATLALSMGSDIFLHSQFNTSVEIWSNQGGSWIQGI